MTTTYYSGRPFAQEDMPDEKQHRRQIARVLNQVMKGHLNNTLSVTLTVSSATTVVNDPRISISTAAHFMPTTAHAAAEIAAGGFYAVPAQGVLTITHANNANADRTFNVSLNG